MRKFLAILALPLSLAACETLPVIDAPPANAYTPLATPDRVFQSAEDVVDHYLARANVEGADVDTQIGRNPSGVGTRMVLVTTDGYRDDSVRGEQWRIVLGQTDLGFRVYLGTTGPGIVAALPPTALLVGLRWTALPGWGLVLAGVATGIVVWGVLLLRERHELRVLRERRGAPPEPTDQFRGRTGAPSS